MSERRKPVFVLKRVIVMLASFFLFSFSQSTLAAKNSDQPKDCPEPGQIDWSKVSGPRNNGPNDVSKDFVNPPDPLNDILANDFTAWETPQLDVNGAFTSTGRAQRKAALGNSHLETPPDCGKA